MCTFLYLNINEEAHNDLFMRISEKHGFAQGEAFHSNEAPFECDIKDGVFFRITDGHCDCGDPVGRGDPEAKGLSAYADWLRELRRCPKLKKLRFINCWCPDTESSQGSSIRASEISTNFLAGIQQDTYGCINYSRRPDDD